MKHENFIFQQFKILCYFLIKISKSENNLIISAFGGFDDKIRDTASTIMKRTFEEDKFENNWRIQRRQNSFFSVPDSESSSGKNSSDNFPIDDEPIELYEYNEFSNHFGNPYLESNR